MFITDRDLLAHEPSLFKDLVWIGQRLSKGVASMSGSTLTAGTLDPDFTAANVGPGHVAVIDGLSCEVLSRSAGGELAISRLRTRADSPPIPVEVVTDKPFWVVTFAPQVRLVHLQILRMIGVAPADQPPSDAPAESCILNPSELASLEAFGALAMILAAGAATAAGQSPLAVRAAFYRGLFSQERSRAVARLDLDGDGVTDVERRLNTVLLERA